VVAPTLTAEEMQAGQLMALDTPSLPEETTTAISALSSRSMADFAEGDTVLKYGHDIGKIVAAVKAGDHVHVHNMKTKRW